MKIHIEYDWKCLSDDKIANGKLGGTERMLVFLRNYLANRGYEVNYVPNTTDTFDVAIFSNSNNPDVKAKKKICWCSSWHTDGASGIYDGAVFLSEFMKKELNGKGAVIPICIDPALGLYTKKLPTRDYFICHSNPNRYLDHAASICNFLESRGTVIEWRVYGGNKLYSDRFPEAYLPYDHKYLKVMGVPTRTDLVDALNRAYAYVYPNFSNDSETQCVSQLEAAMLKLPVVVPDREPFREVMRSRAIFVKDEIECGEAIEDLIAYRRVPEYELNDFLYDNVMIRLERYINNIARGIFDET